MYADMSTVLDMNPSGTFRAEVASRLRQGIAARNVKKSDVADFIGMNQTSFSRRVNARLPINVDEADIICAAIGIDRNWLLTGEEPMLDPEWVPPAGFEPAAFCSEEGHSENIVDLDRYRGTHSRIHARVSA